jgi:protein tyrosine phosphatase (PTP) superfamily phosphohydrolase (DUF442 family)
MRRRAVATLALLALAACSPPSYVAAPHRESMADQEKLLEKPEFDALSSREGPARFARVTPGLYRGGQPTRKHLEQLKALGVDTVINLRRENDDAWREERRHAGELGMRFLHFPFYGVFGADVVFLEKILAEMKKGNVYVHCKHGRDRTSLLIALYRVMHEGWEPALAWKLEAVDYGSAQTFWYRSLKTSFNTMTRDRQPQAAQKGEAIAREEDKAAAGAPATRPASDVARPTDPGPQAKPQKD